MTKPTRELTTQERRSIRKLVAGHCANHDSEYGCLPLDCECPMLGIGHTVNFCTSKKSYKDKRIMNSPEEWLIF